VDRLPVLVEDLLELIDADERRPRAVRRPRLLEVGRDGSG
jgi:hypothetical protein